MKPLQIIVDNEITLKLPKPQDAEKLFALVDQNRSYLRQYLPWVDFNVNVNDSKKFIQESRKNFKNGAGFSLLIIYKGKIAGTIGMHYIDQVNKKTEIGYWLAKEFQGKGIMRKCCSTLIEHLFNDLSLHRIEIRCTVSNQASQRIAEILGFTKEGILRDGSLLNRTFEDALVYSLLKTDDRKGQ